jgi:hypothetical protein
MYLHISLRNETLGRSESQINLRSDGMNLIESTSLGCREATWAERSWLTLDREIESLTVRKGRFR